MNSFMTRIARLIGFVAESARAPDGVALGLMERAEAGAGRNPQQARELRRAACAYLRVVR